MSKDHRRKYLSRTRDHFDPSHLNILLKIPGSLDGNRLQRLEKGLEELLLDPPSRRREAALRSDLSAVLLTLAAADQDPAHLLRALDAAARALELQPSFEPALFNRALILSALAMSDQAAEAWAAYLQSDPDSAWAAEAHRRLRRLETHRTPVDLGQKLEAHLDVTLAEWTTAVSVGDVARARELEQVLMRTAADLRQRSGEHQLLDLLGELRRHSPHAGPHTGPHAWHRAFSAYAAGRRAFEAQDHESAREQLQQARDLFDSLGSSMTGWADIWLAGLDQYDGRFEEALRRLEPLEHRLGDRSYPALEGRLHWTRGYALARSSRYGSSLAEHARAERVYEQAGFANLLAVIRWMKAETLAYMGLAWESWTDRLYALLHIRSEAESWAWARRGVLISAAETSRQLGLFEAFDAFSRETVAHARSSGPPSDHVEALLFRADGLIEFGRHAAALDPLLEAARDFGKLESRYLRDHQRALLSLHAERLRTGSDSDAVRAQIPAASIDDAIDHFRGKGPETHWLRALVAKARLLRLQHELEAADRQLGLAIEQLRRSALDVQDPDGRLAAWEQAQVLFDERIDLLLQQGRTPAELLALAERALGLAGEPRRFEGSRGPLMVWLATSTRVLAWRIEQDRRDAWVLPVSAPELERRIDAFVHRLQLGIFDQREAGALYDLVFGGRKIEGSWFLVPDRFLHRLPFAALRDPDGRFTIEEASLRWSSHAAVKTRRETSPAAGTTVLVGNPAFDVGLLPWLGSLPGAEREVRGIAELAPGALLLEGQHATKHALLEHLPGASVLHVAAHALPARGAPASSPLLVLADAGDWQSSVLTHRDLESLDLSATELVFLSGCRTAPGSSFRTQGLYGLASPFLRQGVRTVVGTLWDIDDRSSIFLTRAFYRAYLAGVPAAEALNRAQNQLVRSEEPALRHPAAWAAFQSISSGEGAPPALVRNVGERPRKESS